ncbi:hypothetical protein BDV38DRAFT_268500 [Aspergillus pseudotamarii]|uniref:Uncharacterized protein n=1 Tax=Aspergillus pseudotamarii TaxID=132259 RepID=A0A5N6T4N0_ASPPS|nr:uncharacterized protein BDV38DRAFT_268500 [Aspergillus pseudotamarii]KAE8141209.1 hypothetical protein BDV38DRAFT_268500 [Aspergillus pseudotamarii]
MSSENSDTRTVKEEDDFKYNPELNYPMVKLADLPEPPKNWRVCGRTAEEASKARKATSEEAKKWGDLTNLRCFKVLWKLFYYQQDKHRPQDFDQIKDFKTRDAGPRLLQCSVDVPDLLPISRYYPHPPPATRLPAEGFHRPLDALASRPDSHIEQMLYPVFGVPKEVNNFPEEIETAIAQTTGNGTCNRNQLKIRLPKVMARSVMETIERAVMQFAYEDLTRDCSAVAQDGQVHLTATAEEDLRQANIGSFPATSHVKLALDPDNSDRLVFSADGDKYPYRGRGPVYRNNSSGIDSIIVVGKLLDAGSTVLDRKGPEWRGRFTNVEKAFIEATDVNWDLCSRGDSRDRFWAVMAAETENVGVGVQSPLLDMWNVSTEHFDQFLFTYDEQTTFCSPCTNRITNAAYQSATVAPPTCPEDMKGVSMQQLVSRSFASEYISRCGKCQDKVVKCRRMLHGLPMRLTVTLDGSVPVKKHTGDISFDYITNDGQRGTAAYRWLGGIYCKDEHYRVYWNDTKRGEVDTGQIQMYDSTMLSGIIVGGIAQTHRDDKVPETWWKNKPVPLLVYERIMNPGDEVMNVALHTLGDMVKVRNQQKLLLQGHISWTPSEPPRARAGFPWRRLIDRKEDRFHLASGAYDPKSQGQISTKPSGVDRHANIPGPSSAGPSKTDAGYLTSSATTPETQLEIGRISPSLFNAPTASMFAEISPLLALAKTPSLSGLESIIEDTALINEQLNGPQQGQYSAPNNVQNNTPYVTQSSSQLQAGYNIQRTTQPSGKQHGQSHGQYNNTRTNTQHQRPYNTHYITQATARQPNRYNARQHAQSNGQHRTQYNTQYGVQPSTHPHEPHGTLDTSFDLQDIMNDGIFQDWTTGGIDDFSLSIPELSNSVFASPKPNHANSTNIAPAPVENNFKYSHQDRNNGNSMPQYIDPSVLNTVPQNSSSLPEQVQPRPMDSRRPASHVAPAADARWHSHGDLLAGSYMSANQTPQGSKRKRVDGAEARRCPPNLR